MSCKRTHPGVVCVCQVCGVEFHPPLSSVSLGGVLNPGCGKFCSRTCSGIGRRGARLTMEERYWKKVGKNGPVPAHCPELGPCWTWSGSTNGKEGGFNYGVLGVTTCSPKLTLAHRFSYELHIGPIPEGLWVLHRCDNPPCSNPAHLFVGDAVANGNDMIAKGRHPYLCDPNRDVRGEANSQAVLTNDLVREIRRRKEAGQKRRQVSRELGLPRSAIDGVWYGYSWTHVSDDASADNQAVKPSRIKIRKPAPLPRKGPMSLDQRLWRRVNKDGPIPESCPELGPCWLWTGKPTGGGYGTLGIGGGKTTLRAHILSYTLEYGPIPDGLFVLHKCDVRGCVRPSHLFLGDAGINARDMSAKGRSHFNRPESHREGEAVHNAILTPDIVREIRRCKASGMTRQATADLLEISLGLLGNVWYGASWNHVV